MARIITNIKDFETWQSAIRGLIIVKRFDRKGDPVDERIPAGGKIMLTPEERRFNQERVAEASLDPFQNGMLVPLKLVESAEDYDELKGNPNHLTEDDMRALLANPKKLDELKKGVASVSNPTTLQRLLAIAESDEIDVTVKQLKVIKARVAEIAQLPVYEEVETVATSDGRQVVQTSAPSSVAPRNSSVGRR